MIFILHGADTYHSRKTLRAIIQEYQKKIGTDLNMHRIDCEEQDAEIFKDLCRSQSLFSGKKLIIAEHFLHANFRFENISQFLAETAKYPDPVVILWERYIVKDLQKKFAKLFSCVKAQEFEELKGVAKQNFISAEAGARGISLETSEWERLLLCTDAGGIINALDVLLLEREHGDRDKTQPPLRIYALGDTFHSQEKVALATLLELVRQGEDEFDMFNYIAGYNRILLAVKSCAEFHIPITSYLGVHPFVLKKASALSRKLSLDGLIKTHADFFNEDCKIKTGMSSPRDSLMTMIMNQRVS